MKILVVGSLTPGTTAVYLIEALKELGCTVRVVSDVDHPLADHAANGVLHLPGWLRGTCFAPEAVLFVEGGTRRLFPAGMEELDCTTAWYAIDSHVHLELHVATARLFDLTFVAQREFLDAFSGNAAQWLPLAAAPDLFPDIDSATLTRDIDVAYVGSDNRSAYPERARLLDAIRSRYPNVSLGRASPSEMGRIYARARIVFNKSVRNDVNMRYFEAMCSGALLVTDKVSANGVTELFEPGADFLEYEDEASLLRVIDAMLADEALRGRVAERGRRTVQGRHTYRHRAEAIVAAILAARHSVRPGPHHYLPVYHLLRFPDGLLDAASRSLRAIRAGGDRNPLLAITSAACACLARALLWAYRIRYRIRYWRLARRSRRT